MVPTGHKVDRHRKSQAGMAAPLGASPSLSAKQIWRGCRAESGLFEGCHHGSNVT